MGRKTSFLWKIKRITWFFFYDRHKQLVFGGKRRDITHFSKSTHLVRVNPSDSQRQWFRSEPQTLDANDGSDTEYSKLEHLPRVELLSFVLLNKS
jgi:hypothetical protein